MRWMKLVGCCLSVMAFTACGSDDAGDKQGRLALRDGQSLENVGQECGVNLPQCPQGLDCFAFTVDGSATARCVDGTKVCEEILTCTGGTECVTLLSYPGQVTCSGKCTGPDCDDSVSSPVSNQP